MHTIINIDRLLMYKQTYTQTQYTHTNADTVMHHPQNSDYNLEVDLSPLNLSDPSLVLAGLSYVLQGVH